ncbi:putative prenylcysteine lyase [Teratosphaeria destructans]|uniref:Prenylcysteine lyase n=1 Tax=Teratosphaeria destructans TaxID=418781 RepID=A0A9W7W6L5_9PEZI|nr:putative prenylcysteine lyase [Teratosphaeria destructans]
MRFKSSVLFTAASYCTCTWAQEQVILSSQHNVVKQTTVPFNVAIIGAGAAGSSSAYHLSKFAAAAEIPVNITVFERDGHVGGRTTTVNAYNDSSQPVELGASIFVEVNKILVDAVQEFNLSSDGLTPGSRLEGDIPGPSFGVWDGKKLVYTQRGESWWRELARLFWRYGSAPYYVNSLMKKTVGKFLTMYDEPVFPWKDLSQVARDVDLIGPLSSTGEQFLGAAKVKGDFARDIVQASTRVNYAQNLKYVDGLTAMVCMATEGAMAVEGGNWQIFNHMVQTSGARILLNTSVSSIQRAPGSLYRLAYNKKGDQTGLSLRADDFDAVILAAPYQFSNINFNNHLKSALPEAIPYVKLHVTLFTSPHLIAPAFVNQAPGNPRRKSSSRLFHRTKMRGAAKIAQTGAPEYLYKVFSPARLNNTFLSHLLGRQHPRDYTTNFPLGELDISWMYRKVWHSYPYEVPRATFENIQLDDGIWYTSGIEGFITTMETSALMGKNVAKLIVDDWQAKLGDEATLGSPERRDELLAQGG